MQTPAHAQEIQARQAAVEELRPKLDLREELALRGADVRAGTDPDVLVNIAGQEQAGRKVSLAHISRARGLAAVLAAGSVVCLVGWQLAYWGVLPFLIAASLAGAYALGLRSQVKRAVAGVERLLHDLSVLSDMLACLETQRFSSPRLRTLHDRLTHGVRPPSRQIAQLRRLIALLESRKKSAFRPTRRTRAVDHPGGAGD